MPTCRTPWRRTGGWGRRWDLDHHLAEDEIGLVGGLRPRRTRERHRDDAVTGLGRQTPGAPCSGDDATGSGRARLARGTLGAALAGRPRLALLVPRDCLLGRKARTAFRHDAQRPRLALIAAGDRAVRGRDETHRHRDPADGGERRERGRSDEHRLLRPQEGRHLSPFLACQASVEDGRSTRTSAVRHTRREANYGPGQRRTRQRRSSDDPANRAVGWPTRRQTIGGAIPRRRATGARSRTRAAVAEE